jgi:hypothetical protein
MVGMGPAGEQEMSIAKEAIDSSVAQNEIVTLRLTANEQVDVTGELLAECDDSVENDTVCEYWGTTEQGDAWRVHIVRK